MSEMDMRRRTPGFLVVLLMSTMLVTSLQSAAYAGVISTEQYLTAVDRQRALAQVDAVLARGEVQRQLEQLGVDPAETKARVEALTDAELQQLAQDLQNLPAGGLLAVIGVVFIVLLILELVGVTNIFNRI
jgi:uncharacterized pyridoxal phosphate-containing UPF0001 family protein